MDKTDLQSRPTAIPIPAALPSFQGLRVVYVQGAYTFALFDNNEVNVAVRPYHDTPRPWCSPIDLLVFGLIHFLSLLQNHQGFFLRATSEYEILLQAVVKVHDIEVMRVLRVLQLGYPPLPSPIYTLFLELQHRLGSDKLKVCRVRLGQCSSPVLGPVGRLKQVQYAYGRGFVIVVIDGPETTESKIDFRELRDMVHFLDVIELHQSVRVASTASLDI